jgi:hypothetical protein
MALGVVYYFVAGRASPERGVKDSPQISADERG